MPPVVLFVSGSVTVREIHITAMYISRSLQLANQLVNFYNGLSKNYC